MRTSIVVLEKGVKFSLFLRLDATMSAPKLEKMEASSLFKIVDNVLLRSLWMCIFYVMKEWQVACLRNVLI